MAERLKLNGFLSISSVPYFKKNWSLYETVGGNKDIFDSVLVIVHYVTTVLADSLPD